MPRWQTCCRFLGDSISIHEIHSLARGREDMKQRRNDLLLAADLLIHPARNEATGTVLIEALAAGLPV